uniref:Uncharacterized protein n=1 Tax=Panagrolaimus sp. JU765 TaxID=591449 RepID=A0AC34RET0_9BILA
MLSRVFRSEKLDEADLCGQAAAQMLLQNKNLKVIKKEKNSQKPGVDIGEIKSAVLDSNKNFQTELLQEVLPENEVSKLLKQIPNGTYNLKELNEFLEILEEHIEGIWFCTNFEKCIIDKKIDDGTFKIQKYDKYEVEKARELKSLIGTKWKKEQEKEEKALWQKACCVTRLVASSVRVSETAGNLIKSIMTGGDLKIIDKSDNGQADLQTEAGRSSQLCIEHSLQEKFQNELKIIVEKEVPSKVPNKELPTVWNFCLQFREVLEMDSKLPEKYRGIKEEDVVIWVDPLDGTSEFAAANKNKTSNLQQVTVLIGICYQGRAIAGVVHQPYYSETSGRTLWGIVGVGAFGLDVVPKELVVVTTESYSTQLIQSLEKNQSSGKKKLVDRVEKISGAGYSVLKCLEGAAAYVFASDGCKKWDTAAPEALLIAAGGMLTDISGRRINYNAGVQFPNTGGVLATAKWVNHQDYVDAIPDDVKNQLKEFVAEK